MAPRCGATRSVLHPDPRLALAGGAARATAPAPLPCPRGVVGDLIYPVGRFSRRASGHREGVPPPRYRSAMSLCVTPRSLVASAADATTAAAAMLVGLRERLRRQDEFSAAAMHGMVQAARLLCGLGRGRGSKNSQCVADQHSHTLPAYAIAPAKPCVARAADSHRCSPWPISKVLPAPLPPAG